ncbi:NAD(P)/FAD-dependent oxidoreductase [Oerskovia jenensis]|uniref:NADPH-dependent 2,4-dienoyl-CoA reductase/sulfur reductase-like enzyme n=1 Tax=Oerskovia jenensis TaxID=162169 RepID=A0ABS2LHI3_9CELL|nr:FAD-dependent oxidoreductase [Oerskovia jenensis]MBM7479880.1 NADPH-dependent 2,4-dienoyl-CoA reductase/sulfur reductase-like enzyme [Oerskovia jenensis]
MAEEPIVIVGGGLAAAKAAESLRTEGYDGELVVVSSEPHRPYERPPLSKDYLRGEAERDVLFPLPEEWYADHHVDLRTATRAAAIDVAGHALTLIDGSVLPYTRLLLATGSTPRSFAVPGADLQGVHYLRTIEHADLLAATLEASAREGAGRLAVVGDGWIGMEVAASARSLGLDVTVVGRGVHPLGRVLGPLLGEMYGKVHADHDVHLHRNAQVVGITGSEGRVTGLDVADGTHVAADVVVVGVGVTPNVGFAEAAGIDLRDARLGGGLAVDATLATSAPDVWAAGDIASVPSPRYGRPLRVEHWAVALETGPHAARAMLGSREPYDKLPYFFSDQYDVGMEYLGFVEDPARTEVVVSGSLESHELVAFWVSEDRVQAGMTVNTWEQMERVEEIVRSAGPVDRDALEAFRG